MSGNAKGPWGTKWAWLLGTFFGAGLMKPGPGTYGSVAAALLWYLAFHFHPMNSFPRAIATLAATIAVTLMGIPAATIVARESARKDPGFVVIDEVAGQLLVLVLARPDLPNLVLAVILFRLFDIFKPWPIRLLERLPNGTGIVVDDLGAGIYGLIGYALLVVPYISLLRRLHWIR